MNNLRSILLSTVFTRFAAFDFFDGICYTIYARC